MDRHGVMAAWKRILSGGVPLLSIEITRECPLHCPGCYAYGDDHLGGGLKLRGLSDYRDDALVEGILGLVERWRPLHVSLVGGEPLMRQRELSRVLPALSGIGVWSMVVTSGVIPIPVEWQEIPSTTVAVSVDGLEADHNVRRAPATYERILKNIAGRKVNIHLTITGPMLRRAGYLEEYFTFWSGRPEVQRIWISTYTPQVGEQSAERLTPEQREQVAAAVPSWRHAFPKILMDARTGEALRHPPKSPEACTFARMSMNYSADLKTRVEPCVFGGNPDCSQCGCAISVGLHAVRQVKLGGLVTIGSLVGGSMQIGALANRLSARKTAPRWSAELDRDQVV